MNFDNLYELALEAAKNFGSPKNIGGSRLAGVQNSEKPSGYVSSSVGKADNFQERVPIDQKNKKGFDPKAAAKQRNAKLEVDDFDTGATDIRKKTDAEKVSVWDIINGKNKSIFNAFALLNNSQYFKEKMEEIRKDFWGNPKSKTEAGKKGLESINIKDEKDLKNLRFEVSKQRGLTESLRIEIGTYRDAIDNYNKSDEEKFNTQSELDDAEARFKSKINSIKRFGANSKDENTKYGKNIVNYFHNLQTQIRRKSFERVKLGSPTSQLEIQKINLEIAETTKKIEEIAAIKPELKPHLDDLVDISYTIDQLTPIVYNQNLKEKDIYGVEGKSKGIANILEDKIKKLRNVRSSLAENVQKLTALENHTSRVSAYNEQKSKDAITAFEKAVIMGAKNILDFKFKDFNPTSTTATEVDWESELPNRGEIYKMLNLLQSPDSTTNPIFSFIKKLDDPYLELSPDQDISRGVMRHDTDRNMSDNENITVVRDLQRLPFSIISNYYNTVNIATMPIGSAITSDSFRAAYRQFNSLCKSLEGNKQMWDDPTIKGKMKTLLGITAAASPTQSMYNIGQTLSNAITPPPRSNMGEALPKHNKLQIERIIDDAFKVSTSSGASSFKQLASRVDSDLSSAYPRKFQAIRDKLLKGETIEESFDDFAARILQNTEFDEFDYKLDLMEVLGESSKKCTGPTKKASSDRKDKKYTKCAKQPDGSYKRIHFGEKGVRVGGGDSKRAKSFRKRHGCADAKQGSAKQASCSNWS